MIGIGGLTFTEEDPKNFLRIPNFVAAQRFVEAVLDRYHLRATDIEEALSRIAENGNIKPLLRCYQNLMIERDLGDTDFRKSEEIHRDSIYYAFLKNPFLRQTAAEYEITKVR